MTTDTMTIGKALRDARLLRGLPARLVAEKALVARNTITNVEHGYNNPTLNVVEGIAHALGCQVVLVDPLTQDGYWNDPAAYGKVLGDIEEVGKQRAWMQPSMNDADFLAGAMAAMVALGLPMIKLPAAWTLGLMFTNQSPLRAKAGDSPVKKGGGT